MRRLLLIIPLLFALGCSESSTTESSTGTTRAAALPPARFVDLAPIFDPQVAPLGLRVTRAALVDVVTRQPSPTGTHLALYVEPTSAWSDAQQVEAIAPLTRTLAPDLFRRWAGLASFDVCQEPSPTVDNRPEATLTTVEMTRAFSDGVNWATADLVTLLAASPGQPPGLSMVVVEPLRLEPAFQAAADAAARRRSGGD